MGNGSTPTQWLSERWQLKEIGLNIQVAVHIDKYYQCIYAMMTNIVVHQTYRAIHSTRLDKHEHETTYW